MATKKNSPGGGAAPSAEYEALVASFGEAVNLMRKQRLAEAKAAFEALADANRSELELAERSRMYARICERRGAPPPPPPQSIEDRYLEAVFQANNGHTEPALRLIEECLHSDPMSPRYLYARASIHALRGALEQTISDLRQAIAIEPQIRFHAANDPDFSGVREEPTFIDLIEPTRAST